MRHEHHASNPLLQRSNRVLASGLLVALSACTMTLESNTAYTGTNVNQSIQIASTTARHFRGGVS